MYIALNPKKIRQFTTKGIHLTYLRPVGYVADQIEPEFREKIDAAIRNEELFQVPDDEAAGFAIPGLGASEGIKSDEESVGKFTVTREATDDNIQEVKDAFGNLLRVRKMTYTLKLPEDPESTAQPANKIIITDRS